MYSTEAGCNFEKLNELVSLQNQVKASRLQDKFWKENFLEVMKKVIAAVPKSKEDASESVSKIIMVSSGEIIKAIADLSQKVFEIMIDRA